jgi:hypothetical protein
MSGGKAQACAAEEDRQAEEEEGECPTKSVRVVSERKEGYSFFHLEYGSSKILSIE